MNLLTGESLTICVDPELFVPAKEVYLNLMSLVTPQTLVHLKLYSKKIQSFLGMYLDKFRWMSSKMTPKHAWNFDKISPAKIFLLYFFYAFISIGRKSRMKSLVFLLDLSLRPTIVTFYFYWTNENILTQYLREQWLWCGYYFYSFP